MDRISGQISKKAFTEWIYCVIIYSDIGIRHLIMTSWATGAVTKLLNCNDNIFLPTTKWAAEERGAYHWDVKYIRITIS